MRIQNITNTRQQTFGDFIVLERGENATWDNLSEWTDKVSQRKDVFVTDRGGILLSTGEERHLLDTYTGFIATLNEGNHSKEAKITDAILQDLIRTYGQIARVTRTFVINSLPDFKKIDVPGFEDLAQSAGKKLSLF